MKTLDFIYNTNDGNKVEILFEYTEGSPGTYWEPEEYPEIQILHAKNNHDIDVYESLSVSDKATIDQCAYERLHDYWEDQRYSD